MRQSDVRCDCGSWCTAEPYTHYEWIGAAQDLVVEERERLRCEECGAEISWLIATVGDVEVVVADPPVWAWGVGGGV